MNIEHILDSADVEARLREGLRDGLGMRLARYTEAVVPWECARYSTFADEDLTGVQLRQFEYGGKTMKGPSSREWLISKVAPGPDAFLVAEDWSSYSTDDLIQQRRLPTVYAGKEVYYVVAGHPDDEPNWKRFCRDLVPEFYMFLIHGVQRPELGAQLTKDALRSMAKGVQKIIAGVYDGESYLIADLPRATERQALALLDRAGTKRA